MPGSYSALISTPEITRTACLCHGVQGMGHPCHGIMIGQGYGCKSYGCCLSYECLRAQITIGGI